MLHAEVGGLSAAYGRTGDGPALVLLHGFTHDSRVWRPQLDSLSDPGAGHISNLEAPAQFNAEVRDFCGKRMTEVGAR